MEIEITVTYAINKRVVVPAELTPDAGWNYPDREKFDEFVQKEADKMVKEQDLRAMGDCWVSTEALETENWNEVYESK